MNRPRIPVLFCLFCIASTAYAQSADPWAQGLYAFHNYDSSPIDVVDPATDALMIHIPLISYPQKGKLPPITFYLRSNSHNWYVDNYGEDPQGNEWYSYELIGYPGVSVEVSPTLQWDTATFIRGYDLNGDPEYWYEDYVQDDTGGQ